MNIKNRSFIMTVCLSLLIQLALHAEEKKDKKDESGPTLITRDFGEDDPTANDWRTQDGNKLTTGLIDKAHGPSLLIPAKFPGLVQASRGNSSNPVYLAVYKRFSKKPSAVVDKISFDLYVPEDIPSGARVGCTFYVKSKDGVWFQARPIFAETGKPATALVPGWNRLETDLSEQTGYLEPVGSRDVWSRYHLGLTRQFGFNIFCDQDYNGKFAIDNFSARLAQDKFRQPMKIVSLRPGPTSLPRMQMYEAAFRLNRPILNPFNTKEVDIVAEVSREGSDETFEVPAFFYQAFERKKGSDKNGEDYRDHYTPQPLSEFRIRITPKEAGKYNCRLKARYTSVVSGKTEECSSEELSFTATQAPAKGFVRVSKTDPHLFEYADGSFFYPVGYNFHTPVDRRHKQRILDQFFPNSPTPVNRGLRIYEDAITRMKAAGINSFEVWMSAWWLEIEWSERWFGYNGVNYYNQQHAWKLDKLLEVCHENGLRIHLVIDNHGKASGHCDPEWRKSPYNRRNGGMFGTPEEFFSRKEALEYYKDKYRYIAARWGFSPEIFGIEMWSELNLTGSSNRTRPPTYKTQAVYKWLETMSGWMRKYDHGNHPITVHYSSDYNMIDRNVVTKPYIDYIVGDAYHAPRQKLVDLLERTQNSLSEIPKPYVMTEFCGNFNASSVETMFGDMYSGLWFTWCTNAAGGPYSWWHELINQEDYYHIYAAFTRYIEGEDKRRAKDQPQLTTKWNHSLHLSKDAGNIAKIEKLVAEDQKNAVSIDPKTKKKKVKPTPFRTVINGKRYAVTNVKLLAEIRKLAHDIKKYDAQILGDGNVFYCYIYEKTQLDKMPLDKNQRELSKDITFELTVDSQKTVDVEIWDCYKGRIIKTLNEVQPDTSGNIRINLPDFTIQCALKIRSSSK